MRICLTMTMAACLAVCAGGWAAEPQQPAPVEMGRQAKAMPWLEAFEGAPFVVVRYADIPVLQGHAIKTEYYEIDPDVVASGYSYFFYVRGKDRDYLAGSVVNLVKLCRELAALEELKGRNKGGEFAKGVGDSVAGIGKGLGNLVRHPGVSAKDFGERVRQMGRSAERAVGADPAVGKAESGVDRSQLGTGPAGTERRELAFELGVDVYTDNPQMREALTEFSHIRKAGGLTTWAIPYSIGMLDYFNPLLDDEPTEARIRDFDPYELRRLVGKDLEPLLNQPREGGASPLSRLLLNPNYTPREIAYIGRDLVAMQGVGRLDVVVQALAAAGTPEEADWLTLELRLYSYYHGRVAPLAGFVPFRQMYAAIGRDNVFYFMFAADTLRPWDHTAGTFDAMVQEALQLKARDMEIWTLGDVDPSMVARAAARGVEVRQNMLLNSRLFQARK